MIRTVEVSLWGDRIGILHQGEMNPVPVFEYDREFIESSIELAPLMMPLSERLYQFPGLRDSAAFHGLPGLVADSLPDRFGNAVINLWLEKNGRKIDSMTALERLCYTGKRGMGALEYHPAESLDRPDSSIDVTDLTLLASSILSQKENLTYKADEMSMAQMIDVGSSAGGARAKAVIAWNESTGEIRSGQVQAGPGYDNWLIKFDNVRGNGDHGIVDRTQYTLIEYAYHLMAKDAGIQMSQCRILKKDGLSHFMTRRFDRNGARKIFVQSLGALGHYDYNKPRMCSYETCASISRKIGIGKDGLEELYRRTAFNVIAANLDDHVKNFSFMMDRDGTWCLSPAYDITFAYNPENRWLREHQMTVNGKSTHISDEDLLVFGKKIGLSSRFCRDALCKVESVVKDWPQYAEQCEIEKDTIKTISTVLVNRP